MSSSMLEPFLSVQINYFTKRKCSSYVPSCLMMDYIVHSMNNYLVDNHSFTREAPHYHPYILRLYYGILFLVQCLRAGHDANSLDNEHHEFLAFFLNNHPPESLPVAAPLLSLFRTLCTSQPENKSYGFVYPCIPSSAGPHRRDSFMCNTASASAFCLPNIPGIFALLEDLNSLINCKPQVFPAKGKHIPVKEAETKVFGHYTFPPFDQRSAFEKYALCSPGLQYVCEADKRLHQSFAEYYDCFDFPATKPDDDLRPIAKFLHLDKSMAWFSQVKNVAEIASKYFTGSGTLADCIPHRVAANQYVCIMQSPASPITSPRHSADRKALFPFAFRLTTTVTSPTPVAEAMSAAAQTHIQMFAAHPYLRQFGHPVGLGPFWGIRPIEKSQVDDFSYLSVPGCIRKLMKY